MSSDAESPHGLPPEWARLERSAEGAAGAVRAWVKRTREQEAEIDRLRTSLEALEAERGQAEALVAEMQRLKEQNAAMERRMLQARKRINGLMQKLATLEIEP